MAHKAIVFGVMERLSSAVAALPETSDHARVSALFRNKGLCSKIVSGEEPADDTVFGFALVRLNAMRFAYYFDDNTEFSRTPAFEELSAKHSPVILAA